MIARLASRPKSCLCVRFKLERRHESWARHGSAALDGVPAIDDHRPMATLASIAPTERDEDYARGREAAALLWRRWRERPEIDDPRTTAFAAGALDELIELQHRSADVDKEMRFYS